MLKTKGRFCRSAAVKAEAAESFEECAARAAIPDYRRWHRADDRCDADGDETPFFASVLPYERTPSFAKTRPGQAQHLKTCTKTCMRGRGVRRRHELRDAWRRFFATEADVMICPTFSRAAYPHTGDDGAFWPFWRNTGRTLVRKRNSFPFKS
jgi:hypothetical protein